MKQHTIQKTGAFLAVACAIHCLALPFLIIFMPAAGSVLTDSPLLEVGLIGGSIVLGLVLLTRNYHKLHQNPTPLSLLAIGASVIVLAHMLLPHSVEHIFSPLGAGFIAWAQFKDIHHSRNCNCPA